MAYFSNYGVTSVDLGAPGTGIRSTLPNGSYGDMQGTSMASPHVAGAVALLCDLHPAGTWQQIRDAIFKSVDPVAALQGKVATGGRLNVFQALRLLKPVISHKPLSNQTNESECYTVRAEISPSAVLNTNRLWLLWNKTGVTNAFETNILRRSSGDLYAGCIPTQSLGTTVFYWLAAESLGGERTTHPSNAPAVLHSFRVVEPVSLFVTGTPVEVGAPAPSYGWHTFPSGVTVAASASLYANISSSARFRCTGWSGTGSVPIAGSTNRVAFVLREPSQLNWQWRLQYRLDQTSNVPGLLGISTWWDVGTTASTVTAEPVVSFGGVEYRFVEWQVDGARQPDATNVALRAVSLLMTSGRTATAIYLPSSFDEDTDLLPDWWERHYFGSTNPVPEADSDADGFSNWEEFLDGSNPRDFNSKPSPPVISHTRLPNSATTPAPWPVTALVTDNHAVSEVLLFWRRNEAEWQSRPFTRQEGVNVWKSFIPPPGTNGDNFVYYVEARDLLGLAATNGPHEFRVAYAVADWVPSSLQKAIFPNSSTSVVLRLGNRGNADLFWQLDLRWADDVEWGTNGWTLSGSSNIWHVSTNRFHSPSRSWYLGQRTSKGWRYTSSLQAELNTPPVRLWEKPRLTFWHWMAAELDKGKPGYAWDGGVVKISTNGTTFVQIVPVGGYPHRISYWQPPQFPQGTPCFARTEGWEQSTFDLSGYDGMVVWFRFEFRGDDNTEEEGWYVDDVTVTSELTTNFWFFLQPTNGVLEANSETNLVVNLTSRGLVSARKESELRLSSNAPAAPRIEIPVSMMVRSPPCVNVLGAAQTSIAGEGLVTVVGRLSDMDGDSCRVAVDYSLDGGKTWSKAWIKEATVDFGTVSVSNATPEQLHGVMTKIPGGNLATNTLRAVWATTNNLTTLLSKQTLVRLRARDNWFSGQPALSEPFIVDNEPPSELAFFTVGSHQPLIWSTNNCFAVQWGPASDGEGVGVARYGVRCASVFAAGPPFDLLVSQSNAQLRATSDGTNWWLSVRAMDHFGNLGPASLAGPYWIDTTPPSSTGASIFVVTSEFGSYVVDKRVRFSWEGFSDNLSGIAEYYYSFFNRSGTTNGFLTTNLSAMLDGAIPDQTNTVYVWARDRVGLIGAAARKAVLVLDPHTDFDGDGYSTHQEEIAGTAADNPRDMFAILRVAQVEGSTGNFCVVSWPAITGRVYTLYHRSGLASNVSWLPLAGFTNIPGATGLLSHTDAVHGAEMRFYRLKVHLP
ncbi:MAG: S8 family serine peptidase [Kiritimatiellae bacterium]|nr:S8 family serine peptidase [Kiritimatiellia bacterium]